MFNHQYNFDIEIPKELITKEKHDKIFPELLENKSIIGLCGYAKSGKDTIAKEFIDKYGYHRVAFADNIKIEMNKYFKNIVYDYLCSIPSMQNKPHQDVEDALFLEDGRTLTVDMIDFKTEDIPIKKRLRPFIIWYGEMIREINGSYFWINQALKNDSNGHDKIIVSDVRRIKELDIFEWSNSFHKRSTDSFLKAGCINIMPDLTKKKKPYSALLFHVSQFMLTDKDVLTHECIRSAQERWMFDYTFYVDPRILKSGDYRNRAINNQIKEVVSKFGIEMPDKMLNFPMKQIGMFDKNQ